VNVSRIKIRKGLDLPIVGAATGPVTDAPPVKTVGVVGPDHLGMKPTMQVEVGDRVKLGQPLFEDKRNPGVMYTAPGAGTVSAINRGEKRVLQSVVITLDGDEAISFPAHTSAEIAALSPEVVRESLLTSGLWTALRRRPFSKVPHPTDTPAAIFVTAIDTNPLAPDPQLVIGEQAEAFQAGVLALTRLTSGEVFVCRGPDAKVPAPEQAQVRVAEFEGPHPAGLPGTHMHFLKPVGAHRMCWYVGYQDTIAIGKLFLTGQLWTERVVALAGPMVKQPVVMRTRLGANIEELVEGRLVDRESRIIAGSVFNGRRAIEWAGYLGRYHNQISVLAEGRDRELFGWVAPGPNKFSVTNVFVSALAGARKRFGFTTTTNGSPRAMVPIGNYERVMPLDVLPTQLLRYLLVKDTETAQKLGALELDEEDLALCSFVCVGKYEFGPVLRENLEQIEIEG